MVHLTWWDIKILKIMEKGKNSFPKMCRFCMISSSLGNWGLELIIMEFCNKATDMWIWKWTAHYTKKSFMSSNKELEMVSTKKILTLKIILFHSHLELFRIFKDSRFSITYKASILLLENRRNATFAVLSILFTKWNCISLLCFAYSFMINFKR